MGLIMGCMLFALGRIPSEPDAAVISKPATANPITMRLNVSFEPNEVNAKNPQVQAKAFIKTPNGPVPIALVQKVSEGAVSIQLEVPDMETPFFVVFNTPAGVWTTDDFSVKETKVIARKP